VQHLPRPCSQPLQLRERLVAEVILARDQPTAADTVPLLAIRLPPAHLRVPVTVVAVLIALGVAGASSARIGGSSRRAAVLRIVIGGAAGLAFTYAVGRLFGTAIG
jgi:vacuolar iron transporter family protein